MTLYSVFEPSHSQLPTSFDLYCPNQQPRTQVQSTVGHTRPRLLTHFFQSTKTLFIPNLSFGLRAYHNDTKAQFSRSHTLVHQLHILSLHDYVTLTVHLTSSSVPKAKLETPRLLSLSLSLSVLCLGSTSSSQLLRTWQGKPKIIHQK